MLMLFFIFQNGIVSIQNCACTNIKIILPYLNYDVHSNHHNLNLIKANTCKNDLDLLTQIN